MTELEQKIEIIFKRVKKVLAKKEEDLKEIAEIKEELKKFNYQSEQLDDQIFLIKEKHFKNCFVIFLTFLLANFLSNYIETRFLDTIFNPNFKYYFFNFLEGIVGITPIFSLVKYCESNKEERIQKEKLEAELGIVNHNIRARKLFLKSLNTNVVEYNQEIQKLIHLLKDLGVTLETCKEESLDFSKIEEEMIQEEKGEKRKIKK